MEGVNVVLEVFGLLFLLVLIVQYLGDKGGD